MDDETFLEAMLSEAAADDAKEAYNAGLIDGHMFFVVLHRGIDSIDHCVWQIAAKHDPQMWVL